MDAGHTSDDAADLLVGQHDGQTLRFPGPYGLQRAFQVYMEHFPVKEEERGKGFVVSSAERPDSEWRERRFHQPPGE